MKLRLKILERWISSNTLEGDNSTRSTRSKFVVNDRKTIPEVCTFANVTVPHSVTPVRVLSDVIPGVAWSVTSPITTSLESMSRLSSAGNGEALTTTVGSGFVTVFH